MCHIDQSLAVGFITVNARQQRASLPSKPGVVERKVYNNDDITIFVVLTFAKTLCGNVFGKTLIHKIEYFILL